MCGGMGWISFHKLYSDSILEDGEGTVNLVLSLYSNCYKEGVHSTEGWKTPEIKMWL